VRGALLTALAVLLSGPGPVSGSGADDDVASCLAALDAQGVDYGRVKRRGIDIGVELHGLVGGVELRAFGGPEPLVLDCSLVYSLARAADVFRAHGVQRITYSSAYQRRNVRGTSRPSRHSFGLAIDLHTFVLDGDRVATVKSDYEQGLGDDLDCIGDPLTDLGAVLRALDCQLAASGLFRIVLTPDYDADHYNHFHVEALPWRERADR
jgi:hypothetical protein